VLETAGEDAEHRIEVGFSPGEPKRIRVDGAPVERLTGSEARPLVSVFMPDRLELVKGAPALRRAHLDRLVEALWPARAEARAAYSRALAQRNALLGRIRAALGGPQLLDTWDAEVARHGLELMQGRAAALELLAPAFASRCADLGLPEPAELRYRPRSPASTADALRAELEERRAGDIERGFSGHGPHRDDLDLRHGGRSLRAYGSQGQQRAALLGLLFGERDVLREERGRPPLMLLDDVMSELDHERRERLVELVLAGGQAVITTTEIEHVPGAEGSGVRLISAAAGALEPVGGVPA
jgi:DNA replication and repair protein RecF